MQFKSKKHIIFHILYIVAPLCPAFLKRIDFLRQLSSALWLAEYIKHETERLRPFPLFKSN